MATSSFFSSATCPVSDKKTSSAQLELDLEQNVKKLQQADVLGRVYEYFLGQFALEECRNVMEEQGILAGIVQNKIGVASRFEAFLFKQTI